MNAVRARGDRFGTSLLYGHGAGGDATPSAVISNLSDYCTHTSKDSDNNIENAINKNNSVMNINDISSQHYLRIFANDVPGVMAEVTSTLALHKISIEAVTQHEPLKNDKLITIVMITNSVSYKSILSSIKTIEALENINGKINLIRVFNDND